MLFRSVTGGDVVVTGGVVVVVTGGDVVVVTGGDVVVTGADVPEPSVGMGLPIGVDEFPWKGIGADDPGAMAGDDVPAIGADVSGATAGDDVPTTGADVPGATAGAEVPAIGADVSGATAGDDVPAIGADVGTVGVVGPPGADVKVTFGTGVDVIGIKTDGPNEVSTGAPDNGVPGVGATETVDGVPGAGVTGATVKGATVPFIQLQFFASEDTSGQNIGFM